MSKKAKRGKAKRKGAEHSKDKRKGQATGRPEGKSGKQRKKRERQAKEPVMGSSTTQRPVLRSLSDIYRYFRESTAPTYFISPTPYNLLGIDEWVGGFRYVTYFDSFDGAHARSFSPMHAGPRDFESFESVNAYLLGNKQVIDYIKANGPGQALFVMFDEETEDLAHQLGLDIALPPRELRERIDSKIVTTQLGNEAGVPSVPNVLGRATTYKELKKLAKSAQLGDDLVV